MMSTIRAQNPTSSPEDDSMNVLPEVALLAAPLAADAAAGTDPRSDVSPQSLYFRLRDARADARAEERVAENDPSATGSGVRHWKTVRELAMEILGSHAKDIEVAAWLTESLVRSDGLRGLIAGCTLLRQLIEGFWEAGLYPLPDEDGDEARIAPVAGLSGAASDGSLPQPLRKLILFDMPDGRPVTLWQFEQARALSASGDAGKAPRPTTGAPPFEALDAAARGGGRGPLAVIAATTVQAMQAWDALEQALARMVPTEATPPMRRVRSLLDGLKRLTEAYVPAAVAAEPDAEHSVSTAAGEGDALALPAGQASALPDRDGMLDEIERIAMVFRRLEPNSPLSYTLEHAVRRARMPWPDLLQEMLPEPATRGAILSGLGIRVTEQQS